MKVLHVIPGVGSVYGGPSLSVLSLVEYQTRQGMAVDVVTTNMNGPQQLDVPTQTWVAEKGYRIQYFPCWYLQDYKISISLAQWLKLHVQDYDIVNTHAIFSHANLAAYQTCQRDRVPYIMHPHGMLEPWTLRYKKWKKQPYYQFIEKPALEQASAIRVLATTEVENLQQLGIQTPLALIPNGISAEILATTSDSFLFYQSFPATIDKTLILFLGRIDPKKGLDLLAQAFAQAYQEFPHIHLVIAGPDNIGYLDTVKQFFATQQCLHAVTFTGMITGTLKAAALATADIYVAPSYSEGFSMSVLEGMQAGIPCIITTGCNFPEADEARVAHVVEINADAIANALINCLKDPTAAKAMGDRARQFVQKNYTWDKISSDLIQVYQKVLSQKI
jgi:glycosyltransferase involved in cell wall biosynthesis